MQDAELLSLERIQAFLEAGEEVEFQGKQRQEVYDWMTRLMRQQGYRKQGKAARGLLRRYRAKMTGRSRAQVTRLIGRYLKNSEVKEAVYRRNRFRNRFTQADIELLAKVDEAHETLSGPATRKILEREWGIYQHAGYQRLATVSVAHIYHLRKPEPGGQPGYLRVDTVHQGDRDGVKGVYHINAVDEVTQWQVVGAVAAITQAHLEPVLKTIFRQFPFPIRGFHSDNGSEFINDTVSGLLKKLLIGQTKSRPRKSNDNGLVESKNGAVIRKHIGYGYIAAAHAGDIDRFYQSRFNNYLNFHRPCGQPERVTEPNGKEKFVYRRYATPWETLRGLVSAPETQARLKPELSIESLDRMASQQSDTESARSMQEAKRKLFLTLYQERKSA